MAIGATLVQSSLYDVPGGYRAVLFDRFSGVQPNVRLPTIGFGSGVGQRGLTSRQLGKERISWYRGYSERSCTMSGSSQGYVSILSSVF